VTKETITKPLDTFASGLPPGKSDPAGKLHQFDQLGALIEEGGDKLSQTQGTQVVATVQSSHRFIGIVVGLGQLLQSSGIAVFGARG
jgi:hypothetical protein